MKYSYQNFGRVVVFTLSGDFTIDDSEQLQRSVNERLDGGSRDVVFDCEHLEYVDSSALEVMLRTRERATNASGSVRLVKVDDTVRKILEMTRLDGAFQTAPSVEEAVRSLR